MFENNLLHLYPSLLMQKKKKKLCKASKKSKLLNGIKSALKEVKEIELSNKKGTTLQEFIKEL